MIPMISVIMPVHNGAAYLAAAIESILAQTQPDFELIIVNDGSTDGSGDIVCGFADGRIRLIDVAKCGLVKALNLGLSESRGRYFARMDADDIARPKRLARQAAHLDRHPDIGVLCTDIATIDAEGRQTGVQRQANLTSDILREGLLYRQQIKPVIHPTVMMRREVADALGGYRGFDSAEDHDLWLRAVDRFGFARLDDILLDYRIHPGGVSRAKGAKQATSSAMSAINYLVRRQTGIDLFSERTDLFQAAADEVRNRLEVEVLIPATAFREGRLKMLNGSPMTGWTVVILALTRYGVRALPRSATDGTRRIIDETVARLSQSLFKSVT